MNATEFAILGLLAEEPRSGYDIKNEIEERLSHFWSQSFGHIYPMLKRLDESGLVTKTVERQDGRPDRKVYCITDEGRSALRDWFTEPMSPPAPRNELLLRIFMGRHAPRGSLLRDLREHRGRMSRTLEELRAIRTRLDREGAPPEDDVYWGITLSYGLQVLEAIVEWSRRAETELESLSS